MLRIAPILLASLLLINSSHAFEASGNFWESGVAVFHVGISGSSPTGGSWNDAFKRSMDAWTAIGSFEFIAVDEFLDPCINRGDGQFGDGVTGVDFGSTACGSEFGEDVLAITLTAGLCMNPQCTGGFTITDADIVFNSTESWDIYSGPLRFNGTSEFERVALHELGHALGLDHSAEDSAIMAPFISDTDTLQADDINGLISIYDNGGATETTLDNIYGLSLVLPDNPTFTGPSDNDNLAGSLDNNDNQFEGKALDIYQYTFENDSNIDIQISSQDFDPFLYLVRVSSSQATIPEHTFIDDNSGSGNNARINREIQAGTYWLGVSSANDAQGDYSVSIISNTNSPSSSFESFTSIYGAEVLVNPNPNITGNLSFSDFIFNGKFLDLIQFEITNTSRLQFNLSSSVFDTTLLLVDINADQSLGELFLENDDGGVGTNSRVEATLQPGTYWLGVSSFSPNETGSYNIEISVVLP